MKKTVLTRTLSLGLVTLFLGAAINTSAAPGTADVNASDRAKAVRGLNTKKVTVEDRMKAAEVLQEKLDELNLQALPIPRNFGNVWDSTGYLVPDYFGAINWAYSPPLRKFINSLPGLGSGNANDLGQYIPVAVPDTTSYPADPAKNAKQADYYEIAVVEFDEQMHGELPTTRNRGYVQLDTDAIPGDGYPLYETDGVTPILHPETGEPVRIVEPAPHFLGPAIVSESDRPVRIKFYNLLPIGAEGDLFIPTDTTVMGSGMGPTMDGEEYTQNRANVHLHGNNTVWISDGSPHQWITPADERTSFPQGVSIKGVPDMNDNADPRDGVTTLYYTNSQSARLMFYHDHSFGITRLNVYAGEAAPYIIRDLVEQDLMNGTNLSGVNPAEKALLPKGDKEIPLVIQDRTFVDATTIGEDDPTWAWGNDPATPATDQEGTGWISGTPRTGDLWYPHVYSPAQNPFDVSGANPYGRWMYGPWFFPPTSDIEFPPVTNPFHDPAVAHDDPAYRPPLMPGTPNPSAPGESFMDTPMVNGTAYPYLEVEPTAYRFRILNAANDRFFNLSLYAGDMEDHLTDGHPTEVKFIPAEPGTLPTHLAQVQPDPGVDNVNLGPDWIQIGTEGGFLPTPAIIPPQHTTWKLVATAFNFGAVDKHSLLLGNAERADVIVDFSKYAGRTLILYNDAPAPFPANDNRYDYFANNPLAQDLREAGGARPTEPGYGPNTRTVMQIRVAPATEAPVEYDLSALQDVFKKGVIPAGATEPTTGVFATGQDTIIFPQSHYNEAYAASLPARASEAYIQLNEHEKTFTPINPDGSLQTEPVTLPFEPKAIHDEMSEVFDPYGRMSGFLGLTSPKVSAVNAMFIPFGYSAPPVDIFKGIDGDLDAVQIGSRDDGTQIWQITHNGVDTHPIHTHLFSAQLINRVAWDGEMIPPDDNELGWKETFRVNPLEQTVIAMRPKVPAASELPFKVPNSVRLIDPSMPLGAPLTPPPLGLWFDPAGNQLAEPILNRVINYGWEYVYHCHILSHEEMDMMHTMAVSVRPEQPAGMTYQFVGNGNNRSVQLTWNQVASNQTALVVQRALSEVGPWTTLATLAPDSTTYRDRIGNKAPAYFYRIVAINTVGDTGTPGFPTVTTENASEILATGTPVSTVPLAPTNLTATAQAGPSVSLSFMDNSNDETGFIIRRSAGGAAPIDMTIAAHAGTGQTVYQDTDVVPGGSYTYTVLAVNSAGSSQASNSVTITLETTPSPPSNVTATARVQNNNSARITLTWTDNSNNETGFTVERCENSTFTGPSLVSVLVRANTTTFNTGNVPRNRSYYIRIRANSNIGSSAWINADLFPIRTP